MATAITLFERLGGDAAIYAAADLFYEKIMNDERLRPFFAGLDLQAQVRKQVAFLSWAFDGPTPWRGRDIRSAHAPLRARGLTAEHFDAVVAHFGATLQELGVDRELREAVLDRVEALRPEVLGE